MAGPHSAGHFEQALPVSYVCRLDSSGNHVPAIADAAARLGAHAVRYQGERDFRETMRKAAPVSLGKLDLLQWLGR